MLVRVVIGFGLVQVILGNAIVIRSLPSDGYLKQLDRKAYLYSRKGIGQNFSVRIGKNNLDLKISDTS